MAFSGAEFTRGVLIAWVIFVALSEVAYVISLRIPVPGLVYEEFNGMSGEALFWNRVLTFPLLCLPSSGVIALLFTPIGLLLGNLLRRVHPLPVHLLAYAALGSAIGLLWLAVCRFGCIDPLGPLGLGIGLSIAVAVPLGWLSTALIALRGDRRRRRTSL
jgi:hypothetical protein